MWTFVWCFYPACIYLLKVNNRKTRTRCKISSKVILKTPERCHWRRFSVFIVSFEHISHLVLVFLLLTLNIGCLYTAWDVSNCNLFPGPYFPVFRLNTGKYGLKKLHIWTFLRSNSQSGLLLKTVYRKAVLKRLATYLTHSNPMFYFYTSLETSENQTFSGIFRRYRNETLV